jgi:hypothetical protein
MVAGTLILAPCASGVPKPKSLVNSAFLTVTAPSAAVRPLNCLPLYVMSPVLATTLK